PPPEMQLESTLVTRFLMPPAPPKPTESLSALMYYTLRDRAYAKAEYDSLRAFNYAYAAARIGHFIQPTYATPLLFVPPVLVRHAGQEMSRAHPLPVAVSILAVREARRGVLAHPNEGFPHLVLALAYSRMLPVGQEQHYYEEITSLHQAVDRLSPEEIDRGQLGPMVSNAWLRLFQLHAQYNERDLAQEALDHALNAHDRSPPLEIREEQRQKAREGLQQAMDRMKTELLAARDNYQLARDEAKRRNAPPASHVKIALDHGLVREAAKILDDPTVT